MALPSCLLVSVGGRRSQRLGPSPTLRPLGPSHQRRHKSRVSLQGPPCAHGVSGTPHGEVHDNVGLKRLIIGVIYHTIMIGVVIVLAFVMGGYPLQRRITFVVACMGLIIVVEQWIHFLYSYSNTICVKVPISHRGSRIEIVEGGSLPPSNPLCGLLPSSASGRPLAKKSCTNYDRFHARVAISSSANCFMRQTISYILFDNNHLHTVLRVTCLSSHVNNGVKIGFLHHQSFIQDCKCKLSLS